MKTNPAGRHVLMQELASQGLRMTEQRKLLVKIIQEASSHLDAATLLHLARKRDATINRATVYRTLELLKSRRLVEELDLMHLGGEKHFYEARTLNDHLHLACFDCGKIIEYTSPAFKRLKQEISRKNGFEIGVVRLEIGGCCKDCRAKARKKGTNQMNRQRSSAKHPPRAAAA
jgi:Fur family ferric uptake transcriptional regulator